MSGITYKQRDLNRYRKIYRYLRKKPKNTYFFEHPTQIESFYIDYDNVSTGSYTFTVAFDSAPYVTATSVDHYGNSQANVNVFIASVSKTAVTIELSAIAKCRVHFHAIYIDCP